MHFIPEKPFLQKRLPKDMCNNKKKRKDGKRKPKVTKMRFMVNGEEKELIAYGINGIEWTRDLLGNYGDLNYSEELEECVMEEEDFKWWETIIEKLNMIETLKEILNDYDREIFENTPFGGDLESEVEERLGWLRERMNR